MSDCLLFICLQFKRQAELSKQRDATRRQKELEVE